MKLGNHEKYKLCIKKSPCFISPVRKRMSGYYQGMGRPINHLLIHDKGKHLLEKKRKICISRNGTLYLRTYLILSLFLKYRWKNVDTTGCTICRNNIDPDSQPTNTTTKVSTRFEVKIISSINALYSINRVNLVVLRSSIYAFDHANRKTSKIFYPTVI